MFAKGSYVVFLKHLRLYEWQLVCGKSDLPNVSPFFPLKYPCFLVDISENGPGFLKGVIYQKTRIYRLCASFRAIFVIVCVITAGC
jgi:hypothetical protein